MSLLLLFRFFARDTEILRFDRAIMTLIANL